MWKVAGAVLGLFLVLGVEADDAAARGKKPRPSTASSPIDLSDNDRALWVVNPDSDSVSFFNVRKDKNQKLAEVPVGDEPWSVAVLGPGKKIYVANTVAGTISVIIAKPRSARVKKTIPVGTEPMGIVLAPNNKLLFVANSRSDTVSVIDTKKDKVVSTIPVERQPRALAVTPDSMHLYVTHFLAFPRAGAVEGADDSREGHVSVIDVGSRSVTGTIVLTPMIDTGFLANGSTLGGVPLRFNPDTSDVLDTPTGAFPNLIGSIGISGTHAYVPSIGSSPNGPVRFDVNVQSLVSTIDVTTNVKTSMLNLNRPAAGLAKGQRLFLTTPSAIAFPRDGSKGYLAAKAVDEVVRFGFGPDGLPDVGDPNNPRFEVAAVGKDPRGITINAAGTRAYVMNYVSRDVSVLNLTPSPPVELVKLQATALPSAGSTDAIVLRGKELFNTAIGPAGAGHSAAPGGRMSSEGWGACSSCHPDGLSDGVTWMFANGPRQTLPLDGAKDRVLNWSATFDEVQDFEQNVRDVSGGQGLVPDSNDPVPIGPPIAGVSQDWDAIATYVQQGIRTPISPHRADDVTAGHDLFVAASCDSCHGGATWTRSMVDFTRGDPNEPLSNGQLTDFLDDVDTFDPNAPNERMSNQPIIVPSLGALGFNPPSLLGVFSSAPYFHDGSVATLDDVLARVGHRSAGTSGIDTLSSPADRTVLIQFLMSIDASTPPIGGNPGGAVLTVGWGHIGPGVSTLCGLLTTSPAVPGASVSGMVTGTGSKAVSFQLDSGGMGTFLSTISAYGPYTIDLQVNGGPSAQAMVDVTASAGTCPGTTGRAVLLGNATGTLAADTFLCLDQVTPMPDGCTGVGPECGDGVTPLLHLHHFIAVAGQLGIFSDPNPTGCGHGIVGVGLSGCGTDTVPSCN